MRCERLFALLLMMIAAVACSRETPAPPASTSAPPPPAPTTTALVKLPQPQTTATYQDAIDWFRSAPRFGFVADEGGVHAEGTMTREHVGSEVVELRENGEEWRARATAKGVSWEKKAGGRWAAANAPAYGNRLYQRVTLAFDPAKTEGAAQLVEPRHYRFTNANTGEVHDVRVDAQGRIERITIGNAFDLKITP